VDAETKSERRATTLPAWIVGRRPGRTLLRALALVGASVVVFGVWLLPVRAYGESMRPTYEPGSFHLVNLWAYWRRPPARGDVVAIRLAGRHAVYVKRIVGLPGERVEIVSGVVHIDGRPLEEPYVKFRARWQVPLVALGRDEYFVVGDNRGMRRDLHEFGIVHRGRIVGKVVF
jgi:signal peptidase I